MSSVKIDLSKVKSINPDQNSPFYYDQDLLNNKLTWRLYTNAGNNSKLILRGFYSQNGAFSIKNQYDHGMGDTIKNHVIKGLMNAGRDFARKSRTLYNNRGLVNDAKDAIVNGLADTVIGGAGLIDNFGTQLQDKVQPFINEARNAAIGFDIAKEWEGVMNKSKVISQGDMSKIYERTDVAIPNISELKCIIWTQSEEYNCVKIVEEIYNSYFIGDFNYVNDDKTLGYWTGPAGLNLANDNPLTDTPIPGSFNLHIGPYQFKNLLVAGFTWEYSREYATVSVNGKPKTINWPAYASCTVDLETAKFITKSYLSTTYMPTETLNE